MVLPPFLLYVFAMLYLELPDYFRSKARKALRRPAWAAHRTAGKFWHYSSQLQWFGILFLGALALLSIGEYGFGIFLLSLSGTSLLSKVAHWSGFAKYPVWTIVLKGLGSLCVAEFFLLFLTIAWGLKGNNPWSHLPDAMVKLVDLWRPVTHMSLFVPPTKDAPKASHVPVSMLFTVRQALLEAHKLPPSAPATTQSDSEVSVLFATGPDNAVTLPTYDDPPGTLTPSFRCEPSFACFTEDQLRTTTVRIEFAPGKSRRLFFAVANVDSVEIPKSHIGLTLSTPIGMPQGVSIYRPNTAHDNSSPHWGIEYTEAETANLLPYNRRVSLFIFLGDLELSDAFAPDFQLVFQVYASNLRSHKVVLFVHAVRGQ